MAENVDEKNNVHIVMAPLMAHGHFTPFLELARQIQERFGFTITIATTPLNIQHLKSAISNKNLHLAELPFNPTHHGLPSNVENTKKLHLDDIIKLCVATLSLEDPLHSLISKITQQEGHPPLCIISDMTLGWVTNVAKSFGTKNITFSTCSAYGTLAYMSIWSNLPHRKTESDEFCVPGFPQNHRFHRSMFHRFLRETDGSDAWSRFIVPQIELTMMSDGWICNTVEEIEPLGLQLLRKYLELPVWSIGPILSKQGADKEQGKATIEACIDWLNLKDQNSVLYISFGSQNTINASQMMALAEGLEKSGKPFIWVINPPCGFDMNGEFNAEWLPEGFEERIKDSQKGLLVQKWGPQLEILSHCSTGAFLSHCGWNSVLESLSHGVPLIGWPLGSEQAYNAKMLVEELGVCVELTRTVESVICEEEVKNVIEIVLEQEKGKGKEIKYKATEISMQMRMAKTDTCEAKGSSIRAMDDFVTTILSNNHECIKFA